MHKAIRHSFAARPFAAAAVAAALGAAFAPSSRADGAASTTIYESDFSTRVSAGAIPTADWLEMSYHTGPLAYSYTSWSSAWVPYNSQSSIQDGWAQVWLGSASTVPTVLVAEESGNPCLAFAGSGSKSGIVTHPLFNEFKTGTLRISIDLRAPTTWGTPNGAMLRVLPLYRSQMNNLNWGSASHEAPIGFGTDYNNGVAYSLPSAVYGNGSGGLAGSRIATNNRTGKWTRYIADIDFASGKSSVTAYDLGTDHPTSTSTATQIGSLSACPFYRQLTEARGGITGISIYVKGVDAGIDNTLNLANAALADNISIAWKASGASSFESVYENDFSKRRHRTISPAGTLSATLSAPDETTWTDTFSGYATVDQNSNAHGIVPAPAGTDGTQPIGVDGWRRLNGAGTAGAAVVNFGDAGGKTLRMRVAQGNEFVVVSQPLGRELSSGRVRFSADFRLPEEWRHNDFSGAYITLGTGAFASADKADYAALEIGNVGVSMAGTGQLSTFRPVYTTAGGKQTAQDAALVAKQWYRAVLTADIDSKTYDYALYSLGADAGPASREPEGEPVFSVSGATFANAITSIGSFALMAYGLGNGNNYVVRYDNLKVWTDAGSAAETLVYSNDFGTRTGLVSASRTAVVGAIDRQDDGFDGWTRRNSGMSAVFVQSAANPALAITGAGSHAYALQSLGTTVLDKRLRFTADIRPTSHYTDGARQGSFVFLGDDLFLQGNRNDADFFTSHCAVQFGFTKTGWFSGAGCHTGAVAVAYSGSTMLQSASLDPSHWYRFAVSADPSSQTWSATVYDMGREHPTPATPRGAVVASFNDLAWCNGAPVRGLSAIAVSAFFTPGWAPWDPEDPDAALFDNFRADATDGSFVIVVR